MTITFQRSRVRVWYHYGIFSTFLFCIFSNAVHPRFRHENETVYENETGKLSSCWKRIIIFVLIWGISGNTRKNHPLCHEVIRWKSDVPLTEGQLRSKRDEFWDTAPAFDGRKEIWDALRAGASATEAQDYQLAQAILDGANVSVPNGFLTECYDELGTRYQVPIYCLSYPINIVKEDSGRDSPADCSGNVWLSHFSRFFMCNFSDIDFEI